MQRIEVITRGERRRVWTTEQKRDIVAESLDSGTTPTEVGRKYGIPAGSFIPGAGRCSPAGLTRRRDQHRALRVLRWLPHHVSWKLRNLELPIQSRHPRPPAQDRCGLMA